MFKSILHVTDSLIPGGAERVAVDLANETFRRGVPVYFITTRIDGSLKDELESKILQFCLKRKRTFDIKGIIYFRKLVRQYQITHVHAHGNGTAMFCVVALLGIHGIRIIHHDHNSLLYNRSVLKELSLLRFVDSWIAVSEKIYDWATNRIKFRNVVIILNPINIKKFIYKVPKTELPVNIVFLANYRVEKDYELLIESVSKFVTNYKILIKDQLKVNCYGNYFESRYASEIKRLIKERNLSEYININPPTNNVARVLSTAHFGILCSKSEGLPIALLEYLASNLPVIVTDTGEMGRIVRNANCGLVVPVGDSKQYALALEEMFKKRNLWGVLGNNGRQFVERYHSVESVVDELMTKIYTPETC